MDYYIEFKPCEAKLMTTKFCETETDLNDLEMDFIFDFISETREDWMPQCRCIGYFSESDMEEEVHQSGIDYFNAIQTTLYVDSVMIEDGQIIRSAKISIVKYILEYFENEYCDSSFDAIVGAFVEACLFNYVDKSKWQFGLENANGEIITDLSKCKAKIDSNGRVIWDIGALRPVMWFGPAEKRPISPWVIGLEKGENLFFETRAGVGMYSWDIMSMLGDFSNSFLTWYTAECGYEIPDISKIRATCPVKLTGDCKISEVMDSVSWYMYDNLTCIK